MGWKIFALDFDQNISRSILQNCEDNTFDFAILPNTVDQGNEFSFFRNIHITNITG